jgi:predicted ATP-grasp superfamily ATP-dependent carboligase/protein-tyrosine-phosphatase
MNPVLILGEEPRIVVNIARSLHRHGVPVDVAVTSSDHPALRSTAIRQCLMLPASTEERALGYAVLLEYIESHHYDQLIPASDTALALVADHYAALSELLSVTCPPPDIVGRVLNKAETLRLAEDCDVPIPKATRICSRKELLERGPSLVFPVIAKPCRKGHQAAGTFKTRRFETIEELHEAFRENPKFGIHNLIQEYCPGEGIGIEVLMRGGRPVALFQHRRLKELPATGGVSVLAISELVDPVLEGHAVRLLRAMNWDGVAMVEFRVDRRTRQVALMEVNGRYWGSLGLSIMAGVDFPWYEWQLAHGEHPEVNAHYRIGVSARWTSGAIQRIAATSEYKREPRTVLGLGRELIGFTRDCLPPTRDLLWSISDPRPGWHETMAAVRTLARGVVKRLVTPVIPEAVLSLRRRSRVLGTRARRMYIWMAITRGVKLRRDRLPESLRRIQSVLFVCHGNILRSPMAAALFNRASGVCDRAIDVRSCGLHATPFHQADPRGMAVAQELGIDLSNHRADLLTRDMVGHADVIFVMDQFNEAELLARYPHARHKVFCLSLCHASMKSCLDIHDPYHGDLDEVRHCYETIQVCIAGLVSRLSNGSGQTRGDSAVYGGHQEIPSVTESMSAGHLRS